MPAAAAGALLAGLVLAAVNLAAGLHLPFVVSDSWLKLVHYSFQAFEAGSFAAAWAGHAASAAAALLVVGGCAGLGGVLAPGRRAPAGKLASLGFGFGINALIALGLGLCGLFHFAVTGAVLAAGLAGTIRARAGLPSAWRDLRSSFSPATTETRWIMGALGLMGGVCFVTALAPEIGWDPAYYHLRLPKLYAMGHRIGFVAWIYPSHYPQTIELLYGLAWLGGGEGAARLLNWSFWAWCGLAILSIARRAGDATGLRAAALALALPLAGTLASECYIDLGLTFLELLALAAVLEGRPLAAGCLAGFAMGSKYTAVVAAFALAAAWLARRGGPKGLLVLAGASAAPVLPWLLKNWVFTGDPVAPFLYRGFGGIEWAGGISQAAMVEVIPKLAPASWAERAAALLLGPWWFLKTYSFAVLSPFLIGGLPVLAMRWTGPAAVVRAYVVAGTAAILVLAPDGRYWQPIAFAFATLAALGWRRLESAGPAVTRGGIAAIAWISIGFGPVFHLVDMHRLFTPYWVGLGLEPAWIYHSRVTQPAPWYSVAVSWANRNAPRGSRIAVISDVQAYLFDRDAIFDCDAPGSRRWVARLPERRAGERDLDRQFRQWNVGLVFYIRGKAMAASRGEKWSAGDARIWARWWNRRASRVFYRGQCSVYRLDRPGKPRLQLDLPGPQEVYLMRLADPGADGVAVRRDALDAGVESAVLDGACGETALEARPPDRRSAVALLSRAVGIAPDSAGLWISYGRMLIAAGRVADARAALAKGRELNPLHEELGGAEAELRRAEGGSK